MSQAISITLSFLIVVCIGVIFYFAWMEYDAHKKDVASKIAKTAVDISNEESVREKDDRNLVDQINTINTDIAKTYDTRLAKQKSEIAALDKKVVRGLDAVFKVGASGSFPGGSLLELPGAQAPDLQTIVRVTALSGMSIMDIGAENKGFKACYTPDKCIEFPDASGNMVLKSHGADAAIMLDGATKLRDASGVTSATLQPNGNQLTIDAASTIVGAPNGSADAVLHVQRPLNESTRDAFKVSLEGSGGGDMLAVDREGVTRIKSLAMMAAADNTSAARLTTNNTNLEITATGDVMINGASWTSLMTDVQDLKQSISTLQSNGPRA